jgi:16S rRNA (cytidine1402-2'-O)-methyltransferase
MSGTLFVVATPVGNLEDVTLRALRVLREVDVIAAEDTRRTARLLSHYAIATPSVSFHQHNVRTRVPQLLARLHSGDNVALVTDAGTPGVSDPGVELVEACVQANVSVDPVPGASAPLTAAVASGFPLIPLTIFGFPPHRSKDRIAWFKAVSTVQHTFTFFESPHRVVATLSQAADILGDRPIMTARELTKKHQELIRGSARGVSELLGQPKGELTIVVGPDKTSDLVNDQIITTDRTAEAVAMFGHLEESGRSRRAAMAAAARTFGLPVNAVYAAVEAAKKSGK